MGIVLDRLLWEWRLYGIPVDSGSRRGDVQAALRAAQRGPRGAQKA
jgi:hypothetical protein